jgi:hypothetical protein
MFSILHRKTALVVLLVAILAGIVPLSVSASTNHTATRTPVSFTSTVIEEIEPFEVSVDDAGIFHIRGVTREEVSGDIAGTATVTFAGDFFPAGECTEESCFGTEVGWAQLELAGEDGGWSGTYVFSSSDVPGQEYYSDQLVLRGTGVNAHTSIVAHSPTGGDEESVSFEGVMTTLATPIGGLNTSVRLCASPEDFSFSGGFLSSGAIEGSGGATGDFLIGGGPWTDNYGVAGTVTLNDEHGSVTILFAGEAQDNVSASFQASHVWGHFLVLEGTGEYAELYASGRIIGTAGGPSATCASGFGVNISMVGEAHRN